MDGRPKHRNKAQGFEVTIVSVCLSLAVSDREATGYGKELPIYMYRHPELLTTCLTNDKMV